MRAQAVSFALTRTRTYIRIHALSRTHLRIECHACIMTHVYRIPMFSRNAPIAAVEKKIKTVPTHILFVVYTYGYACMLFLLQNYSMFAFSYP